MKKLILVLVTILIPIRLSSQAITPGTVVNSYNNVAITNGNGTTFALPANASQITWQTSFTSNPASITVQIQTSLDNVNWFSVASSSLVTGDGGTIYSSALFIRCSIIASSGGSGITCGLVAKNAPVAIVSGTTGNLSVSGKVLVGDGTSGAPSYSFSSEPTLGFYRNTTGQVTLAGSTTLNVQNLLAVSDLTAGGGQSIYFNGRTILKAPINGILTMTNFAGTIGNQFKMDALPTIASGFGTSPSITAGSTPLAGSVNVGTGGVATTGTINFNGAAFPSVPFCTYSDSTSNIVTRGTPTTSTLVLNATTPWLGSDIISWLCISSK